MNRSMKLIGAIAIAAIAMTGCKSDDGGDMQTSQPAMGAMNDTCPIMEGNPVSANGGTSSYNGNTIGFCCPGCKGQWETKTDEEKQAFVNSIE